MPRPADQIFLKLAVQQGVIGQQDADDVWGELVRLEAEGAPSKARILCTELGFIDDDLGKQLKQRVRSYLERKEEEVQADSRSERRIAGFELMERLGSGAMGVVFRARHLKLDKIVALKVLNPDFATDDRYVARFQQEARVAAALNHPAIVQAYDVGQAGDVHYIAMEYIDGKTVKELIERRGRLDEQAAVEIVLQVLDALKHAHSRSLIHRDIKPANIIIGRDGRAKVLDLGLAKRTDVESGLTGEGRAIGTPYFMAPEQALDKGADYRADIYSLGATFYNMVTGDKPYVAGTPVAVMNMHLKAPVPDAHDVCPDVSQGLAKIVKKMLAKRPADRYQDHEALARDLEAVLAGLMPELDGGATPDGMDHIASRPTPTTRRPPREKEPAGRGWLVAAAAAACLLGGGLLMARARSQDPARTGPGETATETGEPAVREQAARAALDEVLKPSSASSRPQASKREIAEDLKQVADSFAGTQAGNDAYTKAQQLLKELSGEEAARYEKKVNELRVIALDNRLLEALTGWRELARSLEDPKRKERSEAEVQGLEQRIAALVVEGRRAADEHITSGREDEAVRSLRRILDYLPGDERALTEGRIEELTVAWSGRERRKREETKVEVEVKRSADQERIDALGGKLLDLFRAGHASDALAEARRAADEVKDPALSTRATLHKDALTAALSLGDLGRQAFARLPVDSDLTFHRRGGPAVDGKVAGVTPAGRLQVKLRAQGAETDVAAEDLEEPDLLRLIRKGLGPNNPAYHHAVAALKLYRGDADAADALARARDAGVDLTALKAELDLVAAAPSDGQVPPNQNPLPGTERAGPTPQLTADQDRQRKLDDLARRVNGQQRRMFAEADQSMGGLTGERITLEGLWDFQKLRQFGPSDWRLVRGETHPAPAGSERRGLILDGSGRAELVCPSEGNFDVSIIFFVSGTFRPQESRLQLSAEGKEKDGRRVTCDMGQLVLWSKNKPKTRMGDSRAGELRSGATSPYELRLERVGKRFTSTFNNAVVAQLLTEDEPGEVKLALEWQSAPVDVMALKISVTPSSPWLEARLSDLGKQ